jgi:biofilm protein TabA
MIIDRLDNAAMYAGLGPRIAAALDYLRRTDFTALPDGRYELDGDRLVAIVQRYRTKPPAGARWEAHRRYLDVQYVVQGVERIGYAPLLGSLAVETPYDAQKDIVFYAARGDLIEIPAGSFAIFAPQDVHSPSLTPNGSPPSDVLKVVMKCCVEP